MIAVQESFGQIVIPYSISLGKVAFDLLNETGLLFIPFVAMFIRCFVEARSKGQDEGAPAILAIKNVEKSFYSMLFIMILFVIPHSQGSTQTSFNRYGCGIEETKNSELGAIYSLQPAITNAASNVVQLSPQLPLGMGLFNNITVGMSESLSAKLPCAASPSALNANLAKSYIKIDDEALISNLKKFGEQCYAKGLERIAESITAQNSMVAFPYERDRNYFFGTNLKLAYDGTHTSPNLNPLSFTILDSEYAGVIQSSFYPYNHRSQVSNPSGGANSYVTQNITDNLLLSCDTAAQEYRSLLDTYVTNNLSGEVDDIFKAENVLPQRDENGAPHYPTQTEVTFGYLHQAFLDVITGKRTLVESNPQIANDANTATWKKFVNAGVDLVSDTAKSGATSAKQVMTGIGFTWTNFWSSSERLNIYFIAQLITTLVLAATYIAAPMLIWLSGYSFGVLFNLLFVQFFLVMSYYILNIAHILSNTLNLLAESYYGTVGLIQTAGQALSFVSLTVPALSLISWTAICTIAGMKLGPLMAGFYTGAGVAAAQAGKSVAQSAMNLASGGIGGTKRLLGAGK